MPYHFLKFLIIIIFLCTTQIAFSITKHVNQPKHKKILVHKKHHLKKISIRKIKSPKKPSSKISLPGPIPHAALPNYLLTQMEKNLIDYIYQTITSLRYTTYQLGGSHIDRAKGVYIVDCSSYVNHVLKNIYPNAYSDLRSSSQTNKPTTYDFYRYFTHVISTKTPYWQPITKVDKLRPGDILVFRYLNSLGRERGGHVMVVMDKPVPHAGKYLIRVSDSASAGHSKDTRKQYVSGIGVGILSLKVNTKTLKPNAYAWKIGSRFETRVNFAMARPLDTN